MCQQKFSTVWAKFEGFEDICEISNKGELKIIRNGKWIRTFGITDSLGYKKVYLTKNKVRHSFLVHRMVFETFVRKLKPNEHCHHRNQVKSCNLVTNLIALTKSKHAQEHHVGKTLSQQSVAKRQETRRLKKIADSSYGVGNRTAWNKGKKWSQQSKRKMSEAKLGKKRGPMSQEHKKHISDAKQRKKLEKV